MTGRSGRRRAVLPPGRRNAKLGCKQTAPVARVGESRPSSRPPVTSYRGGVTSHAGARRSPCWKLGESAGCRGLESEGPAGQPYDSARCVGLTGPPPTPSDRARRVGASPLTGPPAAALGRDPGLESAGTVVRWRNAKSRTALSGLAHVVTPSLASSAASRRRHGPE